MSTGTCPLEVHHSRLQSLKIQLPTGLSALAADEIPLDRIVPLRHPSDSTIPGASVQLIVQKRRL
jgi:hypothetical protein